VHFRTVRKSVIKNHIPENKELLIIQKEAPIKATLDENKFHSICQPAKIITQVVYKILMKDLQ